MSRSVAIFHDIKNFRFDLIRKAIEILLDNPHLSNRKVADQVGVSELSIRYWKKQPFWETEKQRIESDRAEAIKEMVENNREEYQRKFEEQIRVTETLRDALVNQTAHAIKISSKAYAKFSSQDDPIKACANATKSGVHFHSRIGMEGITKIIQINESIYQLGIIVDHIQKAKEQEE